MLSAPGNELPARQPVDSVDAFARLTRWLPEMLNRLLASRVYGGLEHPPSNARGIYLFTDAGRHLYVGRTGITARARAGTTASGTSFRSRFDNHTQRGTPLGTAPFANRLMHERARELGIPVAAGWWDRRHGDDSSSSIFGLFCEAKDCISRMECWVVGFDDDERGVRSTVAETYVHAVLLTRYNDFSTS